MNGENCNTDTVMFPSIAPLNLSSSVDSDVMRQHLNHNEISGVDTQQGKTLWICAYL